MFLKSIGSTLIGSLFLTSLMYGNETVAAYLTTDTIYRFASEGQADTLLNYLRYGYSIDMMDAYGNTALCQAILNEDEEAIQNLIDLGANRNANCLHRIPAEKFYKLGIIKQGTPMANARSGKTNPPMASLIWKHKTFWTLALIGGGVALLAGGGGGGGNGDGGVIPQEEEKEDNTTTLTKVSEIDAIIQEGSCPEGMDLINGVCTTRVSGSESTGETPISIVNRKTSPYYLAEFGGSVSTPEGENLTFSGNTTETEIAMQANGVSVSALSSDKTIVNVEKASKATNVQGTSITMTETSADDQGVIAMYATAAGTITNDGDITIISESENESAAMKSDRLISSTGVPGTGTNITNNGTITVIDKGNGSGTVSAISAPGRGITNNGTINLELNTTQTSTSGSGLVQGMYGKNLVNKGTINLTTNSGEKTIYSQVYLMRGFGDQGSVVANDGTLNIGLTNITDSIKGVWSDATNNAGVTIKNTGTINVSGLLYYDPTVSKQVYLMGSEGGIANTTNYGTIQVGTQDTPVDVSLGGILNAMNGANGSLINENLIDFHLYADPTSSNAFSAYVMALADGNIVNNKTINFSFDNTKGTTKSSNNIRMSVMEAFASDPGEDNYASLENNGTIDAILTGSAGSGYFAAMKSSNSSLTNNKKIEVSSNMDNLDLIGLKSTTGYIANTANSEIILKTTGTNANLVGGYSEGSDTSAQNTGSIYLKHYEGSGDITGFGGENNGLIQIEADNLIGQSQISGGIAYASVSEQVEDPIGTDLTESEEEESEETDTETEEEEILTTAETTTKKAQGKTNITLTGKTAGHVNGFEYENGNTNGTTIHHSANTINITANSETREGNLAIYGIYTGSGTDTYRDGVITINASGNTDDSTKIYGLYAKDANITNEKTSVVNLTLNLNDDTDYFVSGMTAIDSSIKQYKETDPTTTRTANNGYRAYNAGTLNINVTGTTTSTQSGDNEEIPFDVVGMLTNSYALNTGTIKLNVAQTVNAKVAGMVAYDGGIIANQGTIIFSGKSENFTPLYASGSNRLYSVNTTSSNTTTTKTTITEDYYATIYNSGKIIVQDSINSEDFTPAGEGYYQKDHKTQWYDVDSENWEDLISGTEAEDAWAREYEEKVETTTIEEGVPVTTTETETYDTTGFFTPYEDDPDDSEDSEQETENSANQNANSEESTQAVNQNLSVQTTQNSLTEQETYTMRINDGMQYVSELGGSFEAEGIHLIGDITAGQSLVMSGNKDTYISNGSGQGALIGDGNTNDLSLTSNSILFNATYAQNSINQNGIDIVMTRKSFNELVNNSSLAQYLENNYKLGNNEAFFNQLKAHTNLSNLTDSLNKLTGKGVMTRFNFEDMTLMRELNYNLNDNIFHAKDSVLSVADTLLPVSFKGGTTSQSKYSLLNKKSGNMSIGLGMAYTKLKSNDSATDDDRQETMYQMVVPMNFNVGKMSLMTSPRVGYAYGNYERTGFNNSSYKGHIEKRVYGLMNEARYPLHLGNWLVEPSLEFNVLGYTQKGHEDAKDFALNIKSQNTYSVESGVGLYLSQEKELGKEELLKVNMGVAAYHEFANPYRLNVGMNGMQGAFTLDDEEASKNHAITRFGIDYVNQNYTLYGLMTSYWDKETNSLFKSGFKMNF